MSSARPDIDARSIKTVLRVAEPSFDDGMVYARYLDELSPGFRMALGNGRLEVVAAAFTQPGHDLSYEHVVFAVHRGDIIGMVSGYTFDQHRSSSGEVLKLAAGDRILGRMGAAVTAAFLRRFGPEADEEYYVWALAVSRESRRQGIGNTLMDSAEDRARANGSSLLTLDVEAKNEGAIRFYENRGMAVVSQWPRLPLVPAGTFRMAKPI
ncbi:MAG: GNAT family N-acetyltransferase [Actinobacteria bacterium]|nr:GNAT family N-acetyltransferase [Actinomycetota bacterium]